MTVVGLVSRFGLTLEALSWRELRLHVNAMIDQDSLEPYPASVMLEIRRAKRSKNVERCRMLAKECGRVC